ncbi:MAG: site-2 protease family protein [Microthrixaceae bacterium]
MFGVPIGINLWVGLVAVVLAVSLAEISLPNVAPGHPDSAYWFAGVVGVAGFLASLVAHELGHSWVALRNDVKVLGITLWLFGGVAKLDGEADDPRAEFRIALAGPAMSALTAVVAGAGAWVTWWLEGSEVLLGLLIWLAGINAVLAVSNLLPAFPLDGGRILRAVLWRHSGRRLTATRVAALWGQILAATMAAVAVWLMFSVAVWSGLWILALSLFLFVAARAEWSSAAPAPEMLDMPVGRMRRVLPAPLPANASVADARDLLEANPGVPFVAVTGARSTTEALVTRDAIARIPPAQQTVVPASSVAEPILALPRVDPADPVRDVVARLGDGRHWWALMSDADGSLAALLSSDVDGLLEVAAGG